MYISIKKKQFGRELYVCVPFSLQTKENERRNTFIFQIFEVEEKERRQKRFSIIQRKRQTLNLLLENLRIDERIFNQTFRPEIEIFLIKFKF